MIKAIFFDADGTLISHKTKSVPQSARESILRLRQQGIRCFLCTGRHKLELDQLPIQDMEFDGYICLNGQIILDGQTNFIWGEPFDKTTLNAIVELFNGHTIPLLLIEKDDMYLNYCNDLVRSVQQRISSPIPKISTYSGNEVYMACAYASNTQAKRLIFFLPKTLKTTLWADGGIDIINATGGKAMGIQKIQSYYGYTKDELMAFGDGDNDIDMLEHVGIGIAMGNANALVKSISDYVTRDIDDAGIFNGLNHYHLL